VAAPRVLLGNYFIVQLGRPHLIFAVSLAASVLNIVLGLVLIPQAGYAGAAVAASVSYCLATVVTVALFLAMSEVPAGELWRVRSDDVALYFRLARQLLRGDFFERAPAESAP
jgi:Na+-driven multidrug efflux pump